MLKKLAQATSTLVAAGALSAGLLATPANAAEAEGEIGYAETTMPSSEDSGGIAPQDAHGDVPAPGTLNVNYIHVYGTGTYVDRVQAGVRSTNLNPLGPTVCNGEIEIAYYEGGQRKVETGTVPSCTRPELMLRPGHYLDFNLGKHLDDGSTVCARSNIGHGWSPYACIDIIA